MTWSLLWMLCGTAQADPDDLARLAPTIEDLAAEVARLDDRVRDADAIGDAMGRLHSRWTEAVPPGSASACRAPEARSVAARSGAFGAAYRDAVQSARAQRARVVPMLEEPTVAPVITDDQRARITDLLERVDTHVSWFGEMSAWHARYIAPYVHGCRDELAVVEGLGRAEPLSWDRVGKRPVALAAVGGGVVCPMEVPADGRVVVAPDGEACVAVTDCSCAPRPVDPAAVLSAGGRTAAR